MVECTSRLVERLRKEIGDGGGEIEIGEEMHQLTADIISRTEFGSSFEKGKELFNHLTILQRRCAQATRHLCFPGSRLVFFHTLKILISNFSTINKIIVKDLNDDTTVMITFLIINKKYSVRYPPKKN